MTIQCMIIDDEPLARKGLKEYIADVDFLRLDAEFDSAFSAMDKLNDGTIQLLFLDIQMPKMNGIELLRSLPKPPLVIVTTAYPQYALEGYELDVLDYLVKPISFSRFVKAAMKAKEHISSRNLSAPLAGAARDDHFFIKTDNTLVKILYIDMLFAEATQNYVTIHTKDKKYLTHLTFKSIEENLPATEFLKVHKSYIVNLSRINSIDTDGIVIGAHTIPISRANKEAIMELILKGKLLKR
ncbi:MAG: LytTR family DNA-binding domain-containing protein [Bacteroidota bacterium]